MMIEREWPFSPGKSSGTKSATSKNRHSHHAEIIRRHHTHFRRRLLAGRNRRRAGHMENNCPLQCRRTDCSHLWRRLRRPECSARVPTIASKTRPSARLVLYFASGSEISKFTTPCGSKPSGAFCACQKLFNVNPAPASRTIASATCVITRPERIRCLPGPSLAPRPPASCSASEIDFEFEIRQAGQTPTRTPASKAANVVKASTCKSIFAS